MKISKTPASPALNIHYGVDWLEARKALKPTVEVSSATAGSMAFFGYDSRGAVFFHFGIGAENSVLITAKEVAVKPKKRHDVENRAELVARLVKPAELEQITSITLEGVEVAICRDQEGRDVIVLELDGEEYMVIIDPETLVPKLSIGLLVIRGPLSWVSDETRGEGNPANVSDGSQQTLH